MSSRTRHGDRTHLLLRKGEQGFDEHVLATSFSAEDPGRRPDCFVRAATAEDVVAAVRLADREGWRVSCCSGGHSWSQNHIRDGGLLVDLCCLDTIAIDEETRTAVIGAGSLSGVLDGELARRKLFFPVGHAYTIGMGGFLLQGGFGWNSRVVGLGCENVTAIDVVLADGRLVRASEGQHSEVFWAARGSGVGFFGIVVAFHLKLVDRPRFTGMKVQVFRLEHMEGLLRWVHEIGPTIAPNVEFQLVFNRKALGIFSPGVEVTIFVLADSRRQAKEFLRFVDKGPLRRKASLTLPLLGLSLAKIMWAAEKVVFYAGTRWFTDNLWFRGPLEGALPLLRRAVEQQPSAPAHMLWQVWNPVTRERPDMAFSLEGDTYLAFYGGLRGERKPGEGSHWALDSAQQLERFGIGKQLADENLARRHAPFMAQDNFDRLERARDEYDPERRFHSFGHLP